MKTHVTFLADGFNQTEQKPNFINDGNFGEDLAHWLIAEFKKFEDILADPEPLQEDWGWCRQKRRSHFCSSEKQKLTNPIIKSKNSIKKTCCGFTIS